MLLDIGLGGIFLLRYWGWYIRPHVSEGLVLRSLFIFRSRFKQGRCLTSDEALSQDGCPRAQKYLIQNQTGLRCYYYVDVVLSPF